jgi:predicted transcriptional regulator
MSEKGKTLEKGKETFEAVRKRLQPMIVKSLGEGGAIRKPRELFEVHQRI